ncbi:PQQ-dependent sugar dehydrogenase [Nakamurella silvestris]|nr:PQQ-dependent sugar dehydrogenase [Nakamurella silvestris]
MHRAFSTPANRRATRWWGAAIAGLTILTGCSSSPTPSPGTGATTSPGTTGSTTHQSSSAAPAPSGSASSSASASVTDSTAALSGEPRSLTDGLNLPWSVTFVDSTALISERDTGRVLELLSDGSTREVATIGGIVHGGEGGLLGLAVRAKQLFAYSTGENGNRIQKFDITGAAGSYGLGTPTTILDGIPAAGNHNGGRIAFGPDGMLYAGVGDAGDRPNAQDLASLSGKILRMDLDGTVPTDNPFPDSLVYSYGHRNVQGLAWAADGTMFASEFGQNTWDELNIIVPGGNYGWPTVEGIAGAEGFVDPVQQWSPDKASPSGIAIVDGTVFIANLRGEILRAVPVADPTQSTDYYTGVYGRIRDVVPGPDGTVWFLTNNTGSRGEQRDGDDHLYSVDLSR